MLAVKDGGWVDRMLERATGQGIRRRIKINLHPPCWSTPLPLMASLLGREVTLLGSRHIAPVVAE